MYDNEDHLLGLTKDEYVMKVSINMPGNYKSIGVNDNMHKELVNKVKHHADERFQSTYEATMRQMLDYMAVHNPDEPLQGYQTPDMIYQNTEYDMKEAQTLTQH